MKPYITYDRITWHMTQVAGVFDRLFSLAHFLNSYQRFQRTRIEKFLTHTLVLFRNHEISSTIQSIFDLAITQYSNCSSQQHSIYFLWPHVNTFFKNLVTLLQSRISSYQTRKHITCQAPKVHTTWNRINQKSSFKQNRPGPIGTLYMSSGCFRFISFRNSVIKSKFLLA